MPDFHRPFEARSWLRARTVEQSFAVNHFDDNEWALEFVEELYAAGAAQVNIIATDPAYDEGPELTTSSTMEIMLPRDAPVGVREAVIVRAAKERPDEIDLEGDKLVVWWD